MPIECSLGEALRLFEEHLNQAGVTQSALTVYTRALHGPFTSMILRQLPEDRRGLPIRSLPVSQIPQSLIHDCMRLSSPFSFRIGRRFLTFLIHAGCLDASLLPRRSTVLRRAIEEASAEPDAHLSLPQAVVLYIKHLSEHSSLLAGALDARYTHLRMFARWKGPTCCLASVRRQHIRDYLDWLQEKRHYRAVSRAAALTELRAFFAYFITTGLLKNNPTDGFRVKKPKIQPPSALEEKQLTALLAAACLRYRRAQQAAPRRGLPRWLAARDWAIVSLLITSGIRTKEITSLHADAVDLHSRLIRISGKGDRAHTVRQRIIPVSEPFTLGALESYLRIRPRCLYPHLFLSPWLQPLGHTGFTNVLKIVAAEAGIHNGLTISEIRRSFISLCAHKGIDPLLLRQLMGHSSLLTTMKYYLSIQQQQVKELWEKNNPLRYFSPQECTTWIL
ncbi:MAG: tyrosine-type recombinase/integrase [Spirochaetes bacterium]|nr:tyrosine-type recombinase/integrase [Spirochaetota bacterium]